MPNVAIGTVDQIAGELERRRDEPVVARLFGT
jgi:hypothetical protein